MKKTSKPLPEPSAPHVMQKRGFGGIVFKTWLEWPDGRKEPLPRLDKPT